MTLCKRSSINRVRTASGAFRPMGNRSFSLLRWETNSILPAIQNSQWSAPAVDRRGRLLTRLTKAQDWSIGNVTEFTLPAYRKQLHNSSALTRRQQKSHAFPGLTT